MKRIVFLLTVALTGLTSLHAQNWDVIRTSGDYYWGVGQGATDEEARQQALAQLSAMIATTVKSDFSYLADETHHGGTAAFEERVQNCVRTYSQATLTNVQFFDPEQKGSYHVRRCYMARTELEKMMAHRRDEAVSFVQLAQEALEGGKTDMALQYYYWAYALLCSLQHPSAVKDAQGRVLADWLPLQIDDVLSGIAISVESTDGDDVNLLVNYDGRPVRGLRFRYNDGRDECYGDAKDGRAMIQLAAGCRPDAYHLTVEYEYRNLAAGQMESVLGVVPRRIFPRAKFVLPAQKTTDKAAQQAKPAGSKPAEKAVAAAAPTFDLLTTSGLLPADTLAYAAKVQQVVAAVRDGRYSDVTSLFTLDGLEMWNGLMSYGKARLVGTPRLRYYKGSGGGTVVRGMQMAFTFTRPRKRTFVEDVALTFNAEGKIENVAFGLGQQSTNDIMGHQGRIWTDDTKELITEFLESYKTAYSLQRLDYLRDIFADDVTIIVGHVARRRQPGATPPGDSNKLLTVDGQKNITMNRYTKDEYLSRLQQIFRRNEFINLRFTKCEARGLQKFRRKEYGERQLFAIQLGQDYTSSLYSDMGYLFLLVDMSNPKEPSIQIRTWQPNETDMDKLFTEGDFYN